MLNNYLLNVIYLFFIKLINDRLFVGGFIFIVVIFNDILVVLEIDGG